MGIFRNYNIKEETKSCIEQYDVRGEEASTVDILNDLENQHGSTNIGSLYSALEDLEDEGEIIRRREIREDGTPKSFFRRLF